jgi:hypothetical protein
MTYNEFKISVALIAIGTLLGCLLVKNVKGEDICPSSRTASCHQVLEIVSPLTGRTGNLIHGPTLFMLINYPKAVHETWHFSAIRTKLSTHTINCAMEQEWYSDGSTARKLIK